MKATIKNFIKEQADKGTSYSKVQAALEVLGHAENAKQADELLQEAKYPKKSGKTGITNSMYEFLLENPTVTEEEFHEWIVKNGTANTLRWEKTHQKARELANSIAAKLTK